MSPAAARTASKVASTMASLAVLSLLATSLGLSAAYAAGHKRTDAGCRDRICISLAKPIPAKVTAKQAPQVLLSAL